MERFTALLAKCMKRAVDAGKDIAVLAHLDNMQVRAGAAAAAAVAVAAAAAAAGGVAHPWQHAGNVMAKWV
jgi:hypothetical protein